ncbi:UDP:flavonoid glycosyltransferase YjiC, YdhE family [Butyrivibrio proteoclasticus]|jgi:UDP:flavonoid glycosyltransferase YjiC (YdhE family)|uniref:UDP:flavonoid glycosyltransferase YjiC, YdhE family n=1 Tax=Butyrivibrio proteoclasticus TaxID=43305 RepID=A0A1I5R8U5_9FIRM|nr:glycosyltransferase [Butyrivibrio proteoclasticus]SFP54913.1 UDP:flavonoid glycosyltransferase YjiC, YdhE family [Butyrivibrio proteoclasticus]
MIVTAVAVGTRGDVNPLAELGEEMTKRGHEFRILTSEAFRPLIESKGVTFLRLDTDADHVMKYMVTDYKTSLDFVNGLFKLKKENPRFMEQTIDAIKGSDLVMYGTCSAFARHAAEYLGIKCARYFYSPMDPTRQYSLYTDDFNSDKVLKSYDGLSDGMSLMTIVALNKWRKSVGLPKWKKSSRYTELNGRKVLTFYPTSPLLMPPDPAWGDHIHVTGYWYHPEASIKDYEEPEELTAFLAVGEKPIFVAFGKAESPELARLQLLTLDALKKTGIRAVVQAYQIPKKDKINTDKLFFIDNVPYAYIFGKVRAVVHHGGNTTNGLGLRAGLPTLVIALALDQHFYGRVDHKLGCGPKPLYIRKKLCTATEIADSLRDLVSGNYDVTAQTISELIMKENGIEEAVKAIEDYVSEG